MASIGHNYKRVSKPLEEFQAKLSTLSELNNRYKQTLYNLTHSNITNKVNELRHGLNLTDDLHRTEFADEFNRSINLDRKKDAARARNASGHLLREAQKFAASVEEKIELAESIKNDLNKLVDKALAANQQQQQQEEQSQLQKRIEAILELEKAAKESQASLKNKGAKADRLIEQLKQSVVNASNSDSENQETLKKLASLNQRVYQYFLLFCIILQSQLNVLNTNNNKCLIDQCSRKRSRLVESETKRVIVEHTRNDQQDARSCRQDKRQGAG